MVTDKPLDPTVAACIIDMAIEQSPQLKADMSMLTRRRIGESGEGGIEWHLNNGYADVPYQCAIALRQIADAIMQRIEVEDGQPVRVRKW